MCFLENCLKIEWDVQISHYYTRDFRYIIGYIKRNYYHKAIPCFNLVNALSLEVKAMGPQAFLNKSHKK